MPETQYGSIAQSDATPKSSSSKAGILERLDFLITRKRWHLFEIADRPWLPNFIQARVQAYLSAVWVHRLPLIQKSSPAEIATKILLDFVDSGQLQASPQERLTIVDFCAGAGGPTPTIERYVNAAREAEDLKPIQFLLTDKYPCIDDWMRLCMRSDNLNFIPQSVDAADPPVSVVNDDAAQSAKQPQANGRKKRGTGSQSHEFSSGARIFRLYFLAFHHFDDQVAQQIMRSQLRTSDGFAIFEVQDRRLSSFLFIPLVFPLMFLTGIFWFWNDPLFLIFTYLAPVLPFIVAFDGIVSCLRTRTWEEVMTLTQPIFEEEGLNTENGGDSLAWMADAQHKERDIRRAESRDWEFLGGTQSHTFPFGRMHYLIGKRKKPAD